MQKKPNFNNTEQAKIRKAKKYHWESGIQTLKKQMMIKQKPNIILIAKKKKIDFREKHRKEIEKQIENNLPFKFKHFFTI